jgi:hypothetical protein
MSRRFSHGLVIFATAICSFSMQISTKTSFSRAHYSKTIWSIALQIWFCTIWKGFSLHMKRLKVLTQITFPGDFRMARSFIGDFPFLYIKCINFRGKKSLFRATVHTVVFQLHINVNQCWCVWQKCAWESSILQEFTWWTVSHYKMNATFLKKIY